MRRVLFILICILSIPGLPLFGGENILENPGFEDGVIDPWEARGGAVEVVTDPPVDPDSYGSYCGRAYNRSSAWMGITTPDLLGQVIEGETYTVGAYVRSSIPAPGMTVQLSFQYDTGSGNQYVNIVSVDNVDDTGWVFLTGTYTIPTGLTSIYFYVEGPGNTYDDIYVDDLYVGFGDYERYGLFYNRGAATDPVPASSTDPVVDPEATTALTWAAPVDPNIDSISGYDVYFGTDPNIIVNPMTSVVTESLSVSLDYDTPYYWRVDSHVVWDSNDITGVINDTVEGTDWTFTTRPLLVVDAGSDVLTYLEILPADLTGTVDYRGAGNITTVTWELGTAAVPEAMQMITRGQDLSGITADPNLLMDWIGTDTRQVGNPLYLSLKGLPAGTYDWLSYHHDAENQHGRFDVTVSDASGSATTTDIDISSGNTPPAKTVPLTITSNGVDDVVLVFDLQDATVVQEQFFLMNGFELDTTGGSVDPLNVDFGSDPNNVMSGYQEYQAQHEVESTFTEQSFSAFGTTVSILPMWGSGPATITDTTNDPSSASQSATLDVDLPGEYIVQLSATDGVDTASDTAVVTVAADACAAAQLETSWEDFNVADFNEDCMVDLDDFAGIASAWLDDKNLTAQE